MSDKVTTVPAIDVAFGAVREERQRQEMLHGNGAISKRDDPFYALAILTEEVGELSTAIMMLADMPADTPEDSEELGVALFSMRQEAVQVAACAVAMIEAIDNDQYP